MKKLAISLAILFSGYSSQSVAVLPFNVGTSNRSAAQSTINENRTDLSIPAFCGGLSFGLNFVYWLPSLSDLNYALSYPDIDGNGIFDYQNGTYHHVDPNNSWGYRANIGYVIPHTGNEIKLTYTHWRNEDLNAFNNIGLVILPSVAAPFSDGPLMIPFGTDLITGTALVDIPDLAFFDSEFFGSILVDIPLNRNALTTISAKSKFVDHIWDLDYSQQINIGCGLKFTCFGGLRYSRLEHEFEVTHHFSFLGMVALPPIATEVELVITTSAIPTVLEAIGTLSAVYDLDGIVRDIVYQKADFSGVGPRLGFDVSYHLGSGFGIIGEIGTALLVGELENKYAQRIEADGTATINPALSTIVLGETTEGFEIVDPVITGSGLPLGGPLINFDYKHLNHRRIIPNANAKLGLSWTHYMVNCGRSIVTVEAGYEVNHYFKALSVLGETGIYAPELRTQKSNDVSFSGPYVGVQVVL